LVELDAASSAGFEGELPFGEDPFMNERRERLCDAEGLIDLVDVMARQIARGRRGNEPLRLVGIRDRGDVIAHRLAAALEPLMGDVIPVGAVDITLYRDDLGQVNRWPVLHGTEIAFAIEGVDLVLVDDVLFTGRTARAALNAVCDLGRPARVRLAVLVDRGHRELPVQPDVAGMTVSTKREEKVRVHVVPVDPRDEIVRLMSD
jgi:pyrimidine operon attenuation protein/uracil phosphoribosyltransferase